MISNNLDKALGQFGEEFEIIRDTDIDLGKGKLGKVRRVTIPWLMQFLKESIFGNGVEILPGDVLHNETQDIYYLVYILNKNYKGTNLVAYSVVLLIADSLYEIQRLGTDAAAGPFGGTKQTPFTSQKDDIRCHLKEISADLRTAKPALLEVASYLLFTQDTEDVQVLDRIVIDSVNYQVEHLDKTALDGLFEVQLTLDKR